MFPASEMAFAAEMDYRRERMIAARPRRRGKRRARHARAPRPQATPPDPAGPAPARGAGRVPGEAPAWRRAA